MSPEDVIDEIKKSGLRGRGGGGFPTGLKWEFTRKAQGDAKYIICNADEGDPGRLHGPVRPRRRPPYRHRGDDHRRLCHRGVEGVIYIRTEYPLAIERLKRALAQAASAGFLGENICGSGFSFEIRSAKAQALSSAGKRHR